MPKEYYIFYPQIKGSISDEWGQCLLQIKNTVSNTCKPVKLNIFTNLRDYNTFLETRKKIIDSASEILKDNLPAISFTVHPPAKPWKIAVEALFIEKDFSEIRTDFYDSIPYVIIKTKWGKEIWAAGLGTGLFRDDARKAAEGAFNQLVGILAKEKMTMDNIVRQWNYIGNILSVRKGFQNYQVFNEVRSEYYNRYRSVSGYPAATGIDMGLDGVIIDFCAIGADKTILVKGLSNPNQINAYEYGQKVLKGMKEEGKPKKQPPQFERALLVAPYRNPVLFVSGTASIKGQETIGIGNIEIQTRVTIENIMKLADPQRINEILNRRQASALRCVLLRVYVKFQKDFNAVERICQELFPSVPKVFIRSDICRNNLLTEIEAEFIIDS